MQKKIFLPIPTILMILGMCACSLMSRDGEGELRFDFNLSYPSSKGYNITQVHATLVHQIEGTTIETDLTVDTVNKRASGVISGLRIGKWDLTMTVSEDGTEVGSGTAEVEVRSGETALVNITINLYTGSIEIHVQWETGITEIQKITASDGAAGDGFGISVAISGDRAIVGAHADNDHGALSGSAYIFHWSGLSWVEQQKLTASDGAAGDELGYSSISISGDKAIVGAYGDDDKGSYSGSAYVFHWNGSSWVEQQKLTASDGSAYDVFGKSVAISGDSALVAAVGDDDNGSVYGSAYVFHWDGSNWVQQQKLTSSDGADGDGFGNSVAISGTRAIVGATGDDDKGSSSGSAYAFHWDGTNWVEQQKLTASDGVTDDEFGQSVAISGDRAIVGATGDDDKGSSSGSAYIFHWNGTIWEEEQKITANDGEVYNFFGHSVAINGDRAIVATLYDNNNTGSVYLFNWNGDSWVEQQKITASDAATGDQFGCSIGIDGDRVIVGSNANDDKGDGSGAAYLFE